MRRLRLEGTKSSTARWSPGCVQYKGQLRAGLLHASHSAACRETGQPSCGFESSIVNGMKIIRAIVIALALSAVCVATSACPEKGPAQKAGEKVDKAVDKTKDAATDATK